jgi:hypothetical protein
MQNSEAIQTPNGLRHIWINHVLDQELDLLIQAIKRSTATDVEAKVSWISSRKPWLEIDLSYMSSTNFCSKPKKQSQRLAYNFSQKEKMLEVGLVEPANASCCL